MKKLSKLGVILLASGLLLTACAKSGNSSHSSSTSSKLTASEQKLLKQATSDYKTFVEGEIDQLLKDTEGFSETLKSGNLEEAKKINEIAKAGSRADKANLVKRFNEGQK